MTEAQLAKFIDERLEKADWTLPEGADAESYIATMVDEALAANPVLAKLDVSDLGDGSPTKVESETPIRDFIRHAVALTKNDTRVIDEYREKDHLIGTDAAGGYIAQTEDSNELIDLTINDSTLLSRCRVVRPNTNALNFPTLSSGFAGYWTAESTNAPTGTTAFTEETTTFGQVTLTMHKLGIFTVISTELLEDSDPSIEAVLRSNISESLAAAFDYGGFHGNATAGIANANSLLTGLDTTITTNEFAVGAEFNFDDIVNLVRRPKRYSNGEVTVFANPAGVDRMLKVKDGNGQYLLQGPMSDAGVGRIWGSPVIESREISTTSGSGSDETPIYAGTFGSSALAGVKNGISFVVDPYSYAQEASIKLVARVRFGFTVAAETHFARLIGLTA